MENDMKRWRKGDHRKGGVSILQSKGGRVWVEAGCNITVACPQIHFILLSMMKTLSSITQATTYRPQISRPGLWIQFISAASYFVFSRCEKGVLYHTVASACCQLNNLSFLLSFLPSLCLQYGCTALQTARGKRPQVDLCVYVNMLNMHALLSQRHPSRIRLLVFPVYFFSHFSFLSTSALHALSSASPLTHLLKVSLSPLCSLSIHLRSWPSAAGHGARGPERAP